MSERGDGIRDPLLREQYRASLEAHANKGDQKKIIDEYAAENAALRTTVEVLTEGAKAALIFLENEMPGNARSVLLEVLGTKPTPDGDETR